VRYAIQINYQIIKKATSLCVRRIFKLLDIAIEVFGHTCFHHVILTGDGYLAWVDQTLCQIADFVKSSSHLSNSLVLYQADLINVKSYDFIK